jgi:hypothetical protein
MITECKGKGADTLWRRAQARDWLRAHTYRRRDRGLRNATIPSSQFRLVYRRFIGDFGQRPARRRESGLVTAGRKARDAMAQRRRGRRQLRRRAGQAACADRGLDHAGNAPEGCCAADTQTEGWGEAQARALGEGAVDALKSAGTGKRARRRDTGDGSVETEGKTARPRHKDALLAILEGIELWHSPDKTPMPRSRSTAISRTTRSAPAVSACGSGISFLRRRREQAGNRRSAEPCRTARPLRGAGARPLYIRHRHLDDRLYLDMADGSWRAVEIIAGDRQLIDRAPVKFIRSGHMLPLPVPVRPLASETSMGVQLIL